MIKLDGITLATDCVITERPESFTITVKSRSNYNHFFEAMAQEKNMTLSIPGQTYEVFPVSISSLDRKEVTFILKKASTKRYIKDRHVAVLYSNNPRHPWASTSENPDFYCMDKHLVKLHLDKAPMGIALAYIQQQHDIVGVDIESWSHLDVEYVPLNTEFQVHLGSKSGEHIVTKTDENEWLFT
ncbi:MAG: hypothetical protein ACPGXY_03155 [Alphaproteobacteria bacterium]